MPKRIFFIFFFPASSCLGVDTRLDKKDLTSGLSVEKRIEKARNASYTIIKINLYGDKKDVDLGMVSVGIGRGVVFKDNGKLIVLSAGHVIFSPEFDEDLYKFLLAEKCFLVLDWNESPRVLADIRRYFEVHNINKTPIDSSQIQHLKKRKIEFFKC